MWPQGGAAARQGSQWKTKKSLVDNSIHFSAWALGIVQVKNVPNILRSSEKQRVWNTQSDKKVDG